MFVEEITYGTLIGGRTTGLMGFTIKFTGQPAEENEVLAAVDAVYRHKRGKGKVIRFEGKFDEQTDLDMLTLARSFKNGGYLVGVICDGKHYHQFFGHIDYLIVATEEEKWVGFEANELWYYMTDDSVDEPTMPEVTRQPELYVIPGENVTSAGLLGFIKKARRVWNVWLEVEMPYLEVVSYTPDTV